jgi:membrane-bound ClpP family serine protease
MEILNLVRNFGSFLFGQTEATEDASAEIFFGLRLSDLEKRVIVDEIIQPHNSGRVRFQDSWWPACCKGKITIFPGEVVYIVGRCNVTLIVEPVVEPAFSTDFEPAVLPI